jgi:hypothetical protein
MQTWMPSTPEAWAFLTFFVGLAGTGIAALWKRLANRVTAMEREQARAEKFLQDYIAEVLRQRDKSDAAAEKSMTSLSATTQAMHDLTTTVRSILEGSGKTYALLETVLREVQLQSRERRP